VSRTKNLAFDPAELLRQTQQYVLISGSLLLARATVIKTLKQIRKDINTHALQELKTSNDGLLCAKTLASNYEQLVQVICQLAADDSPKGWPKGLSLCATGGFGRSELAPGSDLDILFLRKEDTTEIKEMIEKTLYLLWDCGLKVSQATRTSKEAVQLATADHTIATAMLDLRIVFGAADVCTFLTRTLRRSWNAKRNRQFVASKLQERSVRHQRKGPTRYLVEPNVKEGKGGLRDLQSLVWIAQRVAPESVVAGGINLEFFTKDEYRKFEQINRFLWTIRCWLHFISGRAEDRLTFDLQPELARKLNYREATNKPAVERLMKAYFLNAREVGFLTRVFCTKLEENANKQIPMLLGRKIKKQTPNSLKSEFSLVNGRLALAVYNSSEIVTARLIELFAEADRCRVQIHPDALAYVRRVVPGFRAGTRVKDETRSAFLGLLDHCLDLESTLRLMGETGLLGRLIPEFGRIIGQTQFNMYHSYTVDEHTFRAVGFLQGLESGQVKLTGIDMAALLAKTGNRQVLFLAMLLHDTGKGLGDQEQQGAVVTRKACSRLGLEPAQVNLAGWLVENHLLFSDTAQGRDLSDPETLAKFVLKIGSLERLRLLFALTVADIKAVGPDVWSDWKGQLLIDLYTQSEQIFLGKMNPASLAGENQSAQEIKASLQTALPDKGFWQKWLSEPTANYWGSFTKAQLLQHARMIREIWDKNQENGVRIFSGSYEQLTSLVVWSKDEPGLFAALCSITTASGASIASAKVITTKSQMAFDAFLLHDGKGGAFAANNPRALDRMQVMLDAYFTKAELPMTVVRRKSRREAAFQVMSEVVIDNESSNRATLIECVGADAHGLLRDLSQTLNQCRVNIHSAHITTYGERAVDIFYVNEQNGEKIRNGRRLSFIRKKLLAVLEHSASEKQEVQVQQARASRYR